MAQGIYLSQKMSLAQVLAPQMQQSLALLQAPALELKALIEQELQQNPILEEIASQDAEQADKGPSDEERALDPAEPPADLKFDPATEKSDREPVDDFQAEFNRLVQMDQEWRDHFSQTNIPLRGSEEEEEKRSYLLNSIEVGTSLQEHLIEQVGLSEITPEQRPIAEMIIGNIDDYGYLKASLDELSFSTNIQLDKIAEVLTVIQTFHPPGVGARDLRECLMLQLDRVGRKESLEYRILNEFMEQLGKRKFPDIARHLDLGVTEVQEAAERISHLEPRPGRAFLPDNSLQYIVPEVFVQKVGDEYTITTNHDHVPHLRISNTYKDLMSRSDISNEDRDYIRNKINAGKFFIKSIHHRQQTIISIAREIVNRQRDFMEKGVAFLKPLTMVQVAEAVGVHETTVSRTVSAKYMDTPQGVFEMRYFFTSGIQTSSGEGVSNKTVKDKIAEIFGTEDTRKPLSDDQVVSMLKEQGIMIARRTVAKYRAELNILPSNLRRVY